MKVFLIILILILAFPLTWFINKLIVIHEGARYLEKAVAALPDFENCTHEDWEIYCDWQLWKGILMIVKCKKCGVEVHYAETDRW